LNELLGPAQRDLFEWIAAVNEQPAALGQRLLEPAKGNAPRSRVATIQRTDPHSKRKIIGPLSFGQDKILNGNAAELKPARRELRTRAVRRLRDRFGGAVNCKDVPLADAMKNGTGNDSRAAANL